MGVYWYYYSKLVAQVFSTIGATIMISSCRHVRGGMASRILLALAISDFLFSATGIVTSFLKIFNRKDLVRDWWHSIFFAAPHWSFEIASFLWTGTLAFYIIRENRKGFNIIFAHCFIWIATLVYLIVEIFVLLKNEKGSLDYAVRVTWDMVAFLALCNVVLAILLFSRRRKMKLSTTRSNSLVLSRLMLYMNAFIILVVPNVVKDILFFAGIENRTFGGIASTMFALLPLANSLIYVLNTQCFRCCSSRYNKDISITETETSTAAPIVNELKGLEIGQKIGEGIAVVYKGKWRGADVAVKMQSFALEMADDILGFQDSCNDEIQEEAKLMKSLSHPNIVLFMEAGFYNGSICIISEYCSRGSLRDVLESSARNELIWPMKIRLAIGMAQGLQYLHNSTPTMIHRDLKSPNILVDETWHAKIADFGTLRFAEIIYSKDSNTQNHRTQKMMTGLVGTTRWMAPEVIKGEKTYDEKIDIYGFGMILWELIHGKLPFDEIRWNTTIERVILQGKRPMIPLHSCPPRWKVLITMCWQTDASQRPTIRQVLRTLQRIAHEEIWENMDDQSNFTRLQTNLQNIDCAYILQNTTCDVELNNPIPMMEPSSTIPRNKYNPSDLRTNITTSSRASLKNLLNSRISVKNIPDQHITFEMIKVPSHMETTHQGEMPNNQFNFHELV